jgi:hypothetical protein
MTNRSKHEAPAAISLAAAALAILSACGDLSGPGPSDPNAPASVAFNAWRPGPGDTCPVAVHQTYSTNGPDGKLYPTWHPPVDPQTGCSFGHEHGRDPHGSDLFSKVGDFALGYANEQLDTWDPTGRRHEDHVGHKYEWENDIEMHITGGGGILAVTCDILYKLHQGTHSKDAFTNNLHEVIYHAECNDGTEVHMQIMAAIGTPGEFTRTCDGARIAVGPATPANSPRGGGQRVIPDRTCVERHMLVATGAESDTRRALHESWQQSLSLKTEDGRVIAHMDPYFQAFSPSRFHDPTRADLTGRPIEMCYFVEPNGDRAHGGLCATATQNGTVLGLTFDDPRSPFNGVRRVLDINSLDVDNGDGPTVWYTDPFGRNAKTSPFPGSIRQFVAKHDNTGLNLSGPSIGSQRNYGGPGVHAPN